MRLSVLVIAAISLAACTSAPVAAGLPELFDATPDGGRDVRITGLTAERHALIFTCVAA
jgi:hypothetical protein